ncbi:MAG TPA: CYTH and CHAD domain-containing protein [Mycobacteriales bacterium]|nr:CYTH and CHAD domain-containing protein [Mycobacteriales bacterium]
MADPDERSVHSETESEVKLGVPALFSMPQLTDLDGPHPLRADPAGRLALKATYYDTEDLRLARSGVTLRYRTGEGRPRWTLKLPAESAAEGERQELSVSARPAAPPSELTALVTALVRSAPLSEVVRLTTRREVWRLTDGAGQPVAELVDDLVSVVADSKVVARFRELEVERHGIDEQAMTSLLSRLIDAGAIRGAFQPKLVRALGPRATAPTDIPAPLRIGKDDPASALVAEALRAGVRRLLAQDVRVRLRREDAVHQMRVACRRLRSDMRTFGPLLAPDPAAAIRSELSWLADALGAARDLEVLRARLATTLQADPLAPLDPVAFGRLDGLLMGREQAALESVATALAEPRYVALLDNVVALAREPVTTVMADLPCRTVLPRLVGATVDDLDAKAAKLRRGAADRRWHAARIRAKRARYAAEAAAGALGARAAATGAAMAAVQDVLGNHQDAAIAADTVLTIAAQAPDDPALILLCGRLAERERSAVRAYRGQFAKVWKKANAAQARRWLTSGTRG